MTGFSIDTELEVTAVERRESATFAGRPTVEVTARHYLGIGHAISEIKFTVPLSDQPQIGDTITVAAELQHQAYPDEDAGETAVERAAAHYRQEAERAEAANVDQRAREIAERETTEQEGDPE